MTTTVLHVITSLGSGRAERMLTRLVLADSGPRASRQVVISLTDSGVYGHMLRDAGIELHCLGGTKLSRSPCALFQSQHAVGSPNYRGCRRGSASEHKSPQTSPVLTMCLLGIFFSAGNAPNALKRLVGAHGLEPWTRRVSVVPDHAPGSPRRVSERGSPHRRVARTVRNRDSASPAQ